MSVKLYTGVIILLAAYGLVWAAVANSEQIRFTCGARAGLGVWDKHGTHYGTGATMLQARRAALLDCNASHLLGCAPLPFCD